MDTEAEQELAALFERCLQRARGDLERCTELIAEELIKLIEVGDTRLFRAAIAPAVDRYASEDER